MIALQLGTLSGSLRRPWLLGPLSRVAQVFATGRNPNGIVTESRPGPVAAMQRGRAAASPPRKPIASASGSTGTDSASRVTVVADNEYPSRPWH